MLKLTFESRVVSSVHEVREKKDLLWWLLLFPQALLLLLLHSVLLFCYFKALGNPYRLTILIQKKLLSNIYAGIKVSIYKKDEFQILQVESYLH